ncbi:hypothetical protein O5D80_000528 [Batrachochytrium dendrobatidis]|nr:hypothetical protein O5D80_000528 [Batrachochytrium dendrobatidis]
MTVQTDKAAGLKSRQLSRDKLCSAVQTMKEQDITTLLRQPRVGNNSRNSSNIVFGDSMESGEKYTCKSINYEQERKRINREKLEQRISLKQNRMTELETQRWNQMAADYSKSQNLLKSKGIKTKIGAQSVHYNLITHEYHDSAGGRQQAAKDAQDMNYVAVRSARLYLKNNTFNPLMCSDIPKATNLNQESQEKTSLAESIGKNASGNTADKHLTASSLPNICNISNNHFNSGKSDQNKQINLNGLEPHSIQTPNPPQFGRRSYRIIQSAGASKNLTTPKHLLSIVTNTAQLFKDRTAHGEGGSVVKGVPIYNVLGVEQSSWARNY